MRADLEEIRKSVERASALTHQLLAFSRKQELRLQTISLNGVVRSMEPMLIRLLGEQIELKVRARPSLILVEADASQMEQVLMNLVVNARDAMPEGGIVTVETATVILDQTYAQGGVAPGPYAMLLVSDTGIGMDKETQARIFEPFFTTKEKGRGTGLGLSTVYGIVRQIGGSIWVYSEPKLGTTFKIYLPMAKRISAPSGSQEPLPAKLEQGSGTILVVEDEEAVREVTTKVLRKFGYEVLEARSGLEAISLCKQFRGNIDLLLTDAIMPQMSGRDLAGVLHSLWPTMKVLYMSGYSDEAIARHGILDPGVKLIVKPFTLQTLIQSLESILKN
jgi:CheY-like chemotaxis protein/two-component sensor histidine kinase